MLVGLVKKNGIMMIDFALEAQRREGKDAHEAIHEALPHPVPADHDDHDGGADGRRCRSRSARAPAATRAARSAWPSSADCSSRNS